MDPAPITFVRHAMPVTVEGTPPADWHLDGAAKAHVGVWADRLEVDDGIGVLVSSTEPKALETAAAIGERWEAEVREDDRLREAVRPWIGPGYRAVAHRYLRGEEADGWEPHDQVATRMAAAVDDAVAIAGDHAAVVVSHGLAISIHLGARLGPDFDRESFWSRLAFPDAWVLGSDGVLHRSLPPPIVG
jgi:broad specificity phosphatase PhoE